MKFMLTINLYVVTLLLPSIIYGRTLIHYWDYVDEVAKAGGLINGVFQPEFRGHLGMGAFAITHRGILRPIEKKVAMKFTTPEREYLAYKEYRMYSYLGAINDTNVERYGIPVVYYYGTCKQTGLILMAMSLLEQDIEDLVYSNRLFENDVNILILLRDFILASKYMHSHGCRHDDIKFSNLMIRKNKMFIIDFNVSSKMNVKSRSGTSLYLSRAGHCTGIRYPKDDWESFLYSLCTTLGIELPWKKCRSSLEVFMQKSNTTNTLKLIETIASDTLRNVLREFAQHIFDDVEQNEESDHEIFKDAVDKFNDETDTEEIKTVEPFHLCNKKRFPNYNYWYKLIDDLINKSNLPKPVMFSWMTPDQREKAITDFKEHPIPDITKIDEPKNCDYSAMKYPDVDEHRFMQAYKDWKTSTSSNHSKKSSVEYGSSSSSATYASATEYWPYKPEFR